MAGMGMRRGSLPVDDMIDIDDRSNLLVDKIQYSLLFRGRRWPVDSDVGQCLVQQPPLAAAMGLVIQLRHHLPEVHRMRCDVGRVNVVGMACAVRVVGDDHLWPVKIDELRDPGGG